MYKQIERHFRRYLPTLKKQLSDVYARVVLVHDQSEAGYVSTFNRPVVSVDIQILLINGLPDESIATIKNVPLPVSGAGSDSVAVDPISEGALCLLGFAYGSPRHPVIKSVYPNSMVLPGIKAGESYQGDAAGTAQHRTADSWFRSAVNKIKDKSYLREVEAHDNREDYKTSVLKIAGRYLLTVGGYTLKAVGTIRLLSGHTLSLAALENIEVRTKKDFNSKAAKQKMIADKVYLGSEAIDLVEQVRELAEQVSLLDDYVMKHQHTVDVSKAITLAAVPVVPPWLGVKTAVDKIKMDVKSLI